MKTTFTVGKNDIAYFGKNFRELFGNMAFIVPKEFKPLELRKLPRAMTDKEIMAELKPQEITLSDLHESLKTLGHDIWFLCYITDIAGVLRAVGGRWYGGGWDVDAYSVEGPGGWGDSFQVLSHKFLDTENESMALIPSVLSPEFRRGYLQGLEDAKLAVDNLKNFK